MGTLDPIDAGVLTMSWARLADELEQVRRDQEQLRLHYDRLYGLNSQAIQDLGGKVDRLVELAEARGKPSASRIDIRDIPTPREIPELGSPRPANVSWHQNLRQTRVRVPVAGVWTLVGYAVIELIRALADGRISLR